MLAMYCCVEDHKRQPSSLRSVSRGYKKQCASNLRSRSVVVITLGLHPRGPQFEPGRDHILDWAQCPSNVLFPDLHVPVHSFSVIFHEIHAACIRRTVIAVTKNSSHAIYEFMGHNNAISCDEIDTKAN
jgi:hypothetical protein